MIIKPYTEDLYDQWDSFVEKSVNGVFFHKRRFLSYHENRFIDASLLIENERGQLIAVLPSAIDPYDDSAIVSHPGITFGGLVSGNNCRGEKCIQAMDDICQFYREKGYESLRYKSIPHIYQRQLLQDDIYALYRLGANKYRCDISATINLQSRGKLSKGRKYEINKGRKNGVTIHSDEKYIAQIWSLLEMSLLEKHQATPVHSLKEILMLNAKFSNEITFLSAQIDNQVIAGLVLFSMGNVLHTQYISAGKEAYVSGALDFLIESVIGRAVEEGYQYFDYGISNEDQGRILNEGLYRFKRSFGAGSVVHDYYRIDF
jgi:hypothetical protein